MLTTIRKSLNILNKSNFINSLKCSTSILNKYNSTTTTNVENLISFTVNDKTGVATLSMDRQPVNSQNLEFFQALSKTIDQIEENKSKGMILTSSAKTVFSAGLDLNELYKPNVKRFREFWFTFQEAWLKLHGTGIPTAAAIHGHAPAGGCVLALSCDYRVMCPNFLIGLNETVFGIPVPKWVSATMLNVVPKRLAEQSLICGTLHKADAALKIGLIDEMASDKDEAIKKCELYLEQYKKVSPVAGAITKQSLRCQDLQYLEDNRDPDFKFMFDYLNRPETIQSVGSYLENLKNKKK